MKLTDIARRILKCSLVAAALAAVWTAKAQVNTEQVINVGRNAMYFEDYVVAIQYFNQAVQAKPYLARPYLYRALAKLNLEDFRGAEADATRAVELNPFLTDAWEVRGVARHNSGNSAGAVEDYDRALQLLPENRQLSYNLASALVESKNYDRADSLYRCLTERYPQSANGYLGRARLELMRADTLAAVGYIDQALRVDSASFNAHAMRADLAMRGTRYNPDTAALHLDKAIRLQPRMAGLYVNRAYIRYVLNNWMGAMDDYDYALQLEPDNTLAIFNRGLLEMEVRANDRALADFSHLLRLEPDNIRARYNRAVVYGEKHKYAEALADVEYVIKAFPDFPAGYWLRSDFLRKSGRQREAMRDHDRARAMSRALKPGKGNEAGNAEIEEADMDVARREFASLLTATDNTDRREEYNNTAIRGRVQDRNVAVSAEPLFELTYYTSPDELSQNSYFIKEVDDLNNTRILRRQVMVSNRVPQLTDQAAIDSHFKSIDYYNAALATSTPRAADYVARAMDFLSVHNYAAAIADLDRAIALSADFAPAYMLRAQATVRNTGAAGGQASAMALQRAIADYEHALTLSPRNAFAWFNIGNLRRLTGNTAGALEAYTNAIQLKPDLGAAWFNRGYVQLDSGNRQQGIADLSRAGELGMASAYNLIKRMTH